MKANVTGRINMPPGVTAADIVIELNTILRDGSVIAGGTLKAEANAVGDILSNGQPVQIPVVFNGDPVERDPYATFRVTYRNSPQVRGYDFSVSLTIPRGATTLNIANRTGDLSAVSPEERQNILSVLTEAQNALPAVIAATAEATATSARLVATQVDQSRNLGLLNVLVGQRRGEGPVPAVSQTQGTAPAPVFVDNDNTAPIGPGAASKKIRMPVLNTAGGHTHIYSLPTVAFTANRLIQFGVWLNLALYKSLGATPSLRFAPRFTLDAGGQYPNSDVDMPYAELEVIGKERVSQNGKVLARVSAVFGGWVHVQLTVGVTQQTIVPSSIHIVQDGIPANPGGAPQRYIEDLTPVVLLDTLAPVSPFAIYPESLDEVTSAEGLAAAKAKIQASADQTLAAFTVTANAAVAQTQADTQAAIQSGQNQTAAVIAQTQAATSAAVTSTQAATTETNAARDLARAAADLAAGAANVNPLFRASGTGNPRAPTQAELTAFPAPLFGVKAGGTSGWQLIQWTPHTTAGAWVNFGPVFGATFTDSSVSVKRSTFSPASVFPDDVRAVTPDMLSVPTNRLVRFRFGSGAQVEANASLYSDIIDFSTYSDASGGGVNSLAIHKTKHRITHKQAPWGTGTVWNARDLAYLDEVALLAGATFTGAVSGPTPAVGDNTTRLATTAYVTAADIIARDTAARASVLTGQTGGTQGRFVRRGATPGSWVNASPADGAYALASLGVRGPNDTVFIGGLVPGFAGLTPRSVYYLDAAGGGTITPTRPATGYVRPVGMAHSPSELDLNPTAFATDQTTYTDTKVAELNTLLATKAPLSSPVFSGTVTLSGTDLILGSGDQASRGNSGASRALVKDVKDAQGRAVLSINHLGDFTGGTKIYGAAGVTTVGPVIPGVSTDPTHAATRKFVTDSINAIPAPPPPANVATSPRGTGGTNGYVVSRTAGGSVYEDVTPLSPIAKFAPSRVAVMGVDGPIYPGQTGRITGSGAQPGRSHYMGSDGMLTPVPDPRPADWPPPEIFNVERLYLEPGTAYTHGADLYFVYDAMEQVRVTSVPKPVPPPPPPPPGEKLDLTALPLRSSAYGNGITEDMREKGVAHPPQVLVAGDAGLPAGIAPSTKQRLADGVLKDAYLVWQNYGDIALNRLTATPARLGGQVLTRFQMNTGDFNQAEPGVYFGFNGTLQNGSMYLLRMSGASAGGNVTLGMYKQTFANGVVTQSNNLGGGASGLARKANQPYWVRISVNPSTKVATVAFWLEGTPESGAYTFTAPVADLVAGTAGIRSKDFVMVLDVLVTTPDGVIANV